MVAWRVCVPIVCLPRVQRGRRAGSVRTGPSEPPRTHTAKKTRKTPQLHRNGAPTCTARPAQGRGQHCSRTAPNMTDVAREELAGMASCTLAAASSAAFASAPASAATALVLHQDTGAHESQSASSLSDVVPLVQRNGLSTLRGGSFDAAALEALALQALHSEGRMRTFCVLLQAVALVHAWHLRTGRVPQQCPEVVQAHG